MNADSFAGIVSSAQMIVTCGPGGVGKTSSAAAIGIAAAQAGRNTIVVTVDPARRLADALGIDIAAHDDEPHEVVGAGLNGGRLSALMLDAEKTFDRMIMERAGDAARAQKILDNTVYRSIAGSLAGAQDYMAIERLHQLHTRGGYDLIIVDTPPSRDAIDLLEAPDRLMRFLGHPIYRALTMPSRSFAKVANAGTSAFLWIIRKLAGPKLVEDTIEFFRSLSGMEQGIRQRAAEVVELLRSDSTAFVVVSSPREEAAMESGHVVTSLTDRGFGLDALIVNMVHPTPAPLSTATATATATGTTGPLADLIAFHHDLGVLAASEAGVIDELLALAPDVPVARIPLLDEDVHDLDALTRLAALITGTADH